MKFNYTKSTLRKIRLAHQFANAKFAEEVTDIKLQHYPVLRFLNSERRPFSQIEIVNDTGIDRSTLSQMLTNLQKRGVVKSVRSTEDARVNDVHLTQSGMTILTQVTPVVVKIEKATVKYMRSL